MVILGPQILFMLILAMKEGWSALPRAVEVAGGMTLAGLLCLPLIGTFSYLFQTREVLGSWVGDAEAEKIFTRFLALRYVLAPLCLGIIAHYLLGGKFAAAAPADSTDSAEAEQNVRPLVFCLLWFIVPGAQLFLMSKAGLMNINLERYMIVAAIAPLIMLATICRCFPSWGARIATITITLVLVSPFWLEAARGTSAAFQPRHLSWREAVAYVNQECPADLPVFARSGLVEGKLLEKGTNELTKSLLLCTVNGLYALQPGSHPMIPIHDISMLSRYSAEIRQAGGCIVMGSFKADFDCENNMAKTMETIGVPLSRATITCRQDSNIVTVVVRLAKENATTENATSTPVSANSPLIK